MNRKTITRMQRLLPLWALLLVSHAAHAVSLVALSPGVWVDEAQQRIYLSDPSGQPEARSLEDARLLWRAEQPAKLLLALDHYWLALGQSGSSGRGKLLLIDSNTGSLHDELLIDLPAQVSASVLPEPLRQFDAVAREHPQGAQLHWRYLAQPLRGALLQADGSAVAGDGVKAEGVVDIVLRDDRLQATARPDLSADLGAPDALVPEAQRLPTLGSHTRQFRSANADHTMSSGLAADTSQGLRWQWQLASTSGTSTTNAVELPFAYAPFLVLSSRLLYQAPPMGVATSAGRWQAGGVRLVLQDLGDGEVVWSIEALDQIFRGALPP